MATREDDQTPQLPPRAKSILVLGAGELGLAILDAILAHPSFSRHGATGAATRLTLLIRPTSLTDPSPAQRAQQALLRSRGVAIIAADIEGSAQSSLAAVFAPFTAVIHAGGMTLPPGTMTKVTRAVLEAGVPYYIPWQHGVDYDVIGHEGGQGMFSEQIGVRELLRAQQQQQQQEQGQQQQEQHQQQQSGDSTAMSKTAPKTDWVIVSCGIFMSFLFEQFWGVVQRIPQGVASEPAASAAIEDGNDASTREKTQIQTQTQIQITALNSWDDLITTTTAADIGKCTAELLFTPDSPVNTPVYIAGDTLTYGAFADTIERIVAPLGMEVVRRVWPLSQLRAASESDPDDKIKRYRVVFAEGRGLSWPVEQTWSAKQGIVMEGVDEYARRFFNASASASASVTGGSTTVP